VGLPQFLASIGIRSCFRRQTSESVEGVEIHGSAEFISRTKEALALLGRTPFINVIPRYIAVIRQGKRSGMRADASRPTFVVGKPTWKHSALWYAGAIAHDCYHSKLYHEARAGAGGKPPADFWTGTDAEKKCLKFQIEVLESMGADEATVDYLKQVERNPTYQGRNRGLSAWWDYWQRRW
jgi:hypothetical protein